MPGRCRGVACSVATRPRVAVVFCTRPAGQIQYKLRASKGTRFSKRLAFGNKERYVGTYPTRQIEPRIWLSQGLIWLGCAVGRTCSMSHSGSHTKPIQTRGQRAQQIFWKAGHLRKEGGLWHPTRIIERPTYWTYAHVLGRLHKAATNSGAATKPNFLKGWPSAKGNWALDISSAQNRTAHMVSLLNIRAVFRRACILHSTSRSHNAPAFKSWSNRTKITQKLTKNTKK